MTVGEASRQYQLALEQRRALRTAIADMVSFDEESLGLRTLRFTERGCSYAPRSRTPSTRVRTFSKTIR